MIKKNKKNKKILALVIGAASLSLASVGFASFIINTVTGASDNNVSVEVGTVDAVNVTTEITSSDHNIRFDMKQKGCTNPNITNGENKYEDLDFTVTYSIAISGSTNVTDKVNKVKFELDITNINTLIENNYVAFDTTLNNATLNENKYTWSTEITTEGTPVTGSETVAFKWGSVFDEKNPCENTHSDKLVTNLNAFYTAYKASQETPTAKLLTLTVTPYYQAA